MRVRQRKLYKKITLLKYNVGVQAALYTYVYGASRFLCIKLFDNHYDILCIKRFDNRYDIFCLSSNVFDA